MALPPQRINYATNPNFAANSGAVVQQTNQVVNPSFEVDLFSYTLSGCTGAVTASFPQMNKSGTKILQCAADGTLVIPGISMITSTYRPAVTPGQYVGFGGFVATETGYEVRVQIIFRDSAGNVIAGGSYASAWQVGSFYNGAFCQVIGVAPALSTSVAYYVQYRNPADTVNPMASGKRMWVDALNLFVAATQEEAQFWLNFPYFDGSTVMADYPIAWTGTAHQSTSTITTNPMPNLAGSVGTGGLGFTNQCTSGGARYGTTYGRFTWTKGSIGGSAGLVLTPSITGSTGDIRSNLVSLRSNVAKDVCLLFRFRNGSTVVGSGQTAYVTLAPGVWTDFKVEGLAATGAYTNVQVYALVSNSSTNNPGDSLDMDAVLIVNAATVTGGSGGYFDGSFSAPGLWKYAWTGTANASTSTEDVTGLWVDVDLTTVAPSAQVTALDLGVTAVKTQVVRESGGQGWSVPGWRGKNSLNAETMVDWFPPLGRPVTYTLFVNGVSTSSRTVTFPSTVGYVVDPLQPGTAMPVTTVDTGQSLYLSHYALTKRTLKARSNHEFPVGGRYPIASSGPRQAATGLQFILNAPTTALADQLEALVKDAPILLFRPLTTWGNLPGVCYTDGDVSPEFFHRGAGGRFSQWRVEGDLVQPVSRGVINGTITNDMVAANLAGRTNASIAAASGYRKNIEIKANPLGLGS
ncbi:minor tail protein [Arthrobacter phage Waltz]|nr:minor tail protein [Arthrobacter phage Waltz]